MKYLTRPKIQNICDSCGLEVAVDAQEYTVQFSQKGAGKGRFVKAQNKADLCHPCFIEKFCKSGYKPNWIVLQKNDETGKWDDMGSPEENKD